MQNISNFKRGIKILNANNFPEFPFVTSPTHQPPSPQIVGFTLRIMLKICIAQCLQHDSHKSKTLQPYKAHSCRQLSDALGILIWKRVALSQLVLSLLLFTLQNVSGWVTAGCQMSWVSFHIIISRPRSAKLTDLFIDSGIKFSASLISIKRRFVKFTHNVTRTPSQTLKQIISRNDPLIILN